MQKKIIAAVVGFLALAMGLFHLYGGGIQLFPATQQRAIHFGLGLAIIFLIYPFVKKGSTEDKIHQHPLAFGLNIILAIIALLVCGYIAINHIDLYAELMSPSAFTLTMGVIIILFTLEAARRILGLSLPIIASVFLLYAFIGEHLPLMIQHSGYSFERIITQIGLSNQGVFGIPLGVSATYVVLFVLFGSFLERSGAGAMFMDLAMALVGRFRGGSAKVSVVASALFGSISGSQVANVVTTGVLTIPLMKRGGYKPEFAGAVEAVASTGGMILPPVMGAVAFLIADFLQIPYSKVALAALIPALLYFIAVFIMVDLRAGKMGLAQGETEALDIKQLFLTRGHLMLPLLLLIYLLMVVQMTATSAAFWSIVSVPFVSWLRKDTRMGMKEIILALQDGAKLSLVVVAACSTAGIVIGVIDMTGLGLRFSSVLLDLAGGNLLLLCILTMVASLILGMGLPPVACYLILAILGAPAMIQLGVPALAAHLFIFYFGTLSAITPPVALAAFAAGGIAKTSPIKVALVATRLGLVAFIIPFMFVYAPALILDGTVGQIIYATISALIGVFAIAVSLEGFIKKPVNMVSRIILFVSALMLFHPEIISSIIGFALIVLVLLFTLKGTSSPKPVDKEIS